MRHLGLSLIVLAALPAALWMLGCGSTAPAEDGTLPPVQATSPLSTEVPFANLAAPLPGRLVVKLEASVAERLRAHLAQQKPLETFAFPRELAELAARHELTSARPAFGDEASDRALRQRIEDLRGEGRQLDPDLTLPHLQDVFLLDYQGKAAATHVALDYEQSSDVVYAEALFPASLSFIPQDQYYPLQWGPHLMQAEPAWDYGMGSGQTIAIVDSGVDGLHPDLQAAIDPLSYDAVNSVTVYPPIDNYGHGTLVAGIAAAEHSTFGVAGIAPHAGVLSVSVVNGNNQAEPGSIPGAITYAAAHAGIINASLSSLSTSRFVEEAVQAAHAADAILVAAAGNESSLYMSAPANIEWAVAVGAVDQNDQLAAYSNIGTKLDVVAPGGEYANGFVGQILSCWPSSSWQYNVGTSMASPHVAGLAALIRETAPSWNVEQVRSALRRTASDVNQSQWPGFDPDMGFGRVDAEQAVLLAQHQTPLPTANLTIPKYDQRVGGNVKMLGYRDIAVGATGSYAVAWSSSLNGAYTPIASGNVVGGAAPGNVNLGILSPNNFPGAGRYFLRLTTNDLTNNTSSVDYNEIEVCGACTPLPAGAVARWRFNRSEWPNAVDAIGGNTGSYFGAAVPGPDGAVNDGAGFFGWPGSMMRANAVNPPPFYTMTAQAWIRPAGILANGIIAAYRPVAGQGWELGLSAGVLYFATVVQNGSGNTWLFNPSGLAFAWHQVSAVVSIPQGALNPVTLSMYLDGVLIGTANITGMTGFPSVPGAQYFVGGGDTISSSVPNLNWPFEGNVEEVQLFNTALTPAQVQASFAARCGGTC